MSADEQEVAIATLDAMIVKSQVSRTMAQVTKTAVKEKD